MRLDAACAQRAAAAVRAREQKSLCTDTYSPPYSVYDN